MRTVDIIYIEKTLREKSEALDAEVNKIPAELRNSGYDLTSSEQNEKFLLEHEAAQARQAYSNFYFYDWGKDARKDKCNTF